MVDDVVAARTCDRAGDSAASLRIEHLQDQGSILAARDSIEALCQDLCEPNVYFEPWFLYPALKHLGANETFHFLCHYETSGEQRLCGFLLLAEGPLHPVVPLKTYRVWLHSQCFRSLPLVRKGFAEPFWRATLEWFERRPWQHRLLDIRALPTDGELGRALQAVLADRPSFRTLAYYYDTAFLHIGPSYVETLDKAMSRGTKRRIEQRRKALVRAGSVVYTDLHEGPPIDVVVEEFLKLESSGWKGEAGTALASNENVAAFFREVIRAAYDRGRLSFLALRLDGRMIAAQCGLLCPPGVFQFKAAYDESFGKYSPGTLLELEDTRRMHDPKDPLRAGIVWCDSCSGPSGGPPFRCWPGRMAVARYRITTGWAPHALPVVLWPSIQSMLRLFSRALQYCLRARRAVNFPRGN